MPRLCVQWIFDRAAAELELRPDRQRGSLATNAVSASFSLVFRGLIPVLLLALSLIACGGGGDSNPPSGSDSDTRQPVLGSGGDEEDQADAPVLGFPIVATKNTTRVA